MALTITRKCPQGPIGRALDTLFTDKFGIPVSGIAFEGDHGQGLTYLLPVVKAVDPLGGRFVLPRRLLEMCGDLSRILLVSEEPFVQTIAEALALVGKEVRIVRDADIEEGVSLKTQRIRKIGDKSVYFTQKLNVRMLGVESVTTSEFEEWAKWADHVVHFVSPHTDNSTEVEVSDGDRVITWTADGLECAAEDDDDMTLLPLDKITHCSVGGKSCIQVSVVSTKKQEIGKHQNPLELEKRHFVNLPEFEHRKPGLTCNGEPLDTALAKARKYYPAQLLNQAHYAVINRCTLGKANISWREELDEYVEDHTMFCLLKV